MMNLNIYQLPRQITFLFVSISNTINNTTLVMVFSPIKLIPTILTGKKMNLNSIREQPFTIYLQESGGIIFFLKKYFYSQFDEK